MSAAVPKLQGRGMTMSDQLARHAHKIPDVVALRFEGTGRTYAELDERVTRLARALQQRGVGTGDRIAVRFQYEWHDAEGRWWRSYGNELWEFDEHGLMRRREASINDIEISEQDRRFRWQAPGPRPADVPGLGTEPF